MQETYLKLPIELLEPNIIAHSLNNLSYFLKIKKYLQTENYKAKSYFNDAKYQLIFNIICKWYDKYNKFPNINEMKILSQKLNKDNEDLKILIDALIVKVFNNNVDEISPEYLEEETKNFIKENNVFEAMMMSQIDVNEGNYNKIIERMTNAVSVNFDKDLGMSIKEVDKSFELLEELEGNSISTGVPALDNALDGGSRPKEIYVLGAPPGIGKTLLLGNIAINSFLQNKNVLVYTFETSDKRLLSRYYSNLINKTKKEMIVDETGAKQELLEVLRDSDTDLIIKEYPANQVSSADLMAHLNDLKMYKQWVPDVIIVDYILIMSTNDRRLNPENSFKYYKTVTEELRNISKSLEVPIWTAVQLNRNSQDDKGGTKALNTSKNIAESRGVLDTADVFITLNQTAKDKDLNKMMLYFDKSRNGQTGLKINVNVDYDHMRIFE